MEPTGSAQTQGSEQVAGRADVARLAGVSPAVVSYVLNDSHPVSPQTRAKVEAAIETLGYRPNALARSLATARSHMLGLLLPDSSNSFFAQLASAVENAALEAGFVVLLGNGADNAEREIGYVRTFLDRRADGMIAVPGGVFEEGWREISRARIPAVSLDRLPGDLDLPSVVVDNLGGGRTATEHLIGHGRTRIACITGGREMSSARGRAEGWELALRGAGLPVPAEHVIFGDFSAESGHAATLALLERDPEIDGIFVGSDLQGVGVLRALADLGLQAGRDLGVVSFDGTVLSEYMTPRLTTVTQPYDRLAAEAVRMLVTLIEDPARDRTDMHLVLPTVLVPRDTCGCRGISELAAA